MLNDLLRKLRGTKSSSSQTAKKRLKFAIVYDNLQVSDEVLEHLKRDIIEEYSR
ncbi:MAG: cell division topological specificity factor MinE [Desulfobacteraceae bacterium]|nr:cell division topological specificity factor MinE [Desulfobacteraceae bacterium]